MSSSIVTVDLDGYNCLKVSSFISVGRMMKLSFESSCSKLEKMNKRIPNQEVFDEHSEWQFKYL